MGSPQILLDGGGDHVPIFAPVEPTLSSGSSLWPGVVLEEYEVPPGEFPTSTVFLPHVIATFDLPEPLNQFWQDGGRERQATFQTGDVTMRSHQELQACRWDRPATILVLGIEPGALPDMLGDVRGPDARQLAPKPQTQDVVLRHLLLALRADLANGCPAGPLVGESIAAAIAYHTFSRHGEFPIRQSPNCAGIPRDRLRKVLEYIEAHLGEELRIGRLASIASLGSHHFAKLFKLSTGRTVHQYIVTARIGKAKELLRRLDWPIVEVGATVGIPNQSHFTDLFRRRTGQTPAQWRRANC